MKKTIALLFAVCLFLLCSSCGASAPSAEPGHTVLDKTEHVSKLQTPAPTPTEPPEYYRYVAEEISTPDWIVSVGKCAVAGDSVVFTAETAQGMSVVSFDTHTEEFKRYDIDTSMLANPYYLRISATEDSVWLYGYDCLTEVEEMLCIWGEPINNVNGFFQHISLTDGKQTVNTAFRNELSAPPAFIIALDANRALIGNPKWETKTFLIDKDASTVDTPEIEIKQGETQAWVNDKLYVESIYGLARLNVDTMTFSDIMPLYHNNPVVYSSALGHLLITKDSTMYALDADTREKTEVLNWVEVSLSLDRLYGQKGLENSNGDYFHFTDRITKITRIQSIEAGLPAPDYLDEC